MLEVTQRPADLVARYGGEEFCVVLPCTEATGAQAVAARLMQAVAARQIPDTGADRGLLTVSVGIASFDCGAHDRGAAMERQQPGMADAPANALARTLLKIADQALYAAKQAGRATAVLGATTA